MSNKYSEKHQKDPKFGLSASLVDGLSSNGRCRSKSLSGDKVNGVTADKLAILPRIEDNHLADRLDTPGCLVLSQLGTDTKLPPSR